MTKILVLSNDRSLKNLVEVTLKFSDLNLYLAESSKQAWKLLDNTFFNLILVDFELKHESGLAFYKAIRQFEKNIPVIMIGQGRYDELILKDLSLEFYDYILKPFKFTELKKKINKLLNNYDLDNAPVNSCGLIFDFKKGMVIIKDKIIYLTRLELRLLMLLTKKAGNVVSLKKIKLHLEKEEKMHQLCCSYLINRLRKKLEKGIGESIQIISIRNEGIRLVLKA